MAGKVIIFDFDGTIADSHNTLVEITNRLSSEFGYKPIDPEKALQLKNLSSSDIVKQSEISLFKIPLLLRRVRVELGKEIQHLKPIAGIEKSLQELKKQGYQLGIITSNIEENVEFFLENNHLRELFDFVSASKTIFGKHRAINKFIAQNQLNKNKVIYVGDETRDIVAAKDSNIKVIAVGWGFNSVKVLAEYQPNFLIHQPQELVKAIEDWKKTTIATNDS